MSDPYPHRMGGGWYTGLLLGQILQHTYLPSCQNSLTRAIALLGLNAHCSSGYCWWTGMLLLLVVFIESSHKPAFSP